MIFWRFLFANRLIMSNYVHFNQNYLSISLEMCNFAPAFGIFVKLA